MAGSKDRRQGRKEKDAAKQYVVTTLQHTALQSQWSFRCRGNPSVACVASAQQCASDSPNPVKKIKIKNFR